LTLALIDIQSGNLHSVENALRAAGAKDVIVTADPEVILRTDRIVLPGVGAFGACAANLRAVDGLAEALEGAVLHSGRPFLGVCVGMQLMAEYGEEHGLHEGLGWIAGTVKALKPLPGIRVPHMGWNIVQPTTNDTLIEPGEAYFLHSFAYQCGQRPSAVCAVTDHGGEVVAAVRTGTALGVQFHPEKSQRYGLALLERFLAWRP